MSDKPEITESRAGDCVVVKDQKGNEYVCRLQDLKDPSMLSEEERKRCYSNVEGGDDRP